MKVRVGFVSNSSSSSFCIHGVVITGDIWKKLKSEQQCDNTEDVFWYGEYKDEKSNKFYQVKVIDDDEWEVRYGRIGSEGKPLLVSPDKAKAKIKEKIKEGYQPIKGGCASNGNSENDEETFDVFEGLCFDFADRIRKDNTLEGLENIFDNCGSGDEEVIYLGRMFESQRPNETREDFERSAEDAIKKLLKSFDCNQDEIDKLEFGFNLGHTDCCYNPK